MIQFLKKVVLVSVFSIATTSIALPNEEKIAKEFLEKAKENIQTFEDPYWWAITSLHYIYAQKPKEEKLAEQILQYALQTSLHLKKQQDQLALGFSKVSLEYDPVTTEIFIDSFSDPEMRFNIYLELIRGYPDLSTKDRQRFWDKAKQAVLTFPDERFKAECIRSLAYNQAKFDVEEAEKTARMNLDATHKASSLAHIGAKLSTQDPKKAKALLAEAQKLIASIEDPIDKTFAYCLLAISENSIDPEQAKKTLEKAIDLAESAESFLKGLLYARLVETAAEVHPEIVDPLSKKTLAHIQTIESQEGKDKIFLWLSSAHVKIDIDKVIFYAYKVKNEMNRDDHLLQMSKIVSVNSLSDAKKIIDKITNKFAKTHGYCEAYKQYQIRKQAQKE